MLLFRHHSKNLSSIAKEMLDRSTNVIAEIIGVFAANFWALPTPNIMALGLIMTKWFNFVSKTAGNKFVNHSGLTIKSRVSSLDFIKFLSRDETMETLVPLFKERKIYSLKTGKLISPAVRIVAKTGAMYFNRGLAGYVIKNGVPYAAFAIFSADLQKRDSIPKVQFSRPSGSKKLLYQAKNHKRNILIN